MRISVPAETAVHERRVALVPDGVARLVKSGHHVTVQRGAGARAFLADQLYEDAGATLAADAAATFAAGELVLKVQPPSLDEVALLARGATLASLMQPSANAAIIEQLVADGVNGLALELVPRITRAQSMDVLSSQSTVAGYKAVLLGAAELGKFLPMLTTAAGTVAPSRAFVIGAGVAGLQAIATARRLGAIVSAYDVRAVAREQVQSLGATFLMSAQAASDAEAAGGYAREQRADEREQTLQTVGAHLPEVDLVITTAQIPGRPAPRLITAAMVAGMRPGAVIVDLAAETGGNCELTRPGETVCAHGVTILGPVNVASSVPVHASQMLSRNLETLVKHLARDGTLHVDPADEITGAMLVTRSAPTA
ncbi:MAG TPA: Re/Si-specific NAD(P)(+) transhydrogenase subunit alpha [Gemmatimonadaceae bacterium]|jgi:NAD(P) transhydrogenase subunit alpha|nr:Re/Si-specific NAD(P)(+) transhydrogenase subunit alpha [Gemmatimonadaceae bacterium]